MKRICTMCVIACILTSWAISQDRPRFSAPLGVERVLEGVVHRAKPTSTPPGTVAKSPQFTLESNGQLYDLHGHENKLKKLLGKRARVTGHVVGNDVTVATVEIDKQQ